MPQFNVADPPISQYAVDALKKLVAGRAPTPAQPQDLGIPSVPSQHPMQLPQPAASPDPNYPMGVPPGDPIYNKVFDQGPMAPNFDPSDPTSGISWPSGKPSSDNVIAGLKGMGARQGDQLGAMQENTYFAQKKLKDEMERNLSLQAASPHTFFSGATPADLSQITDDINEGPIAQSAKRTAAVGAANDAAQSQGFGGGTSPSQVAGQTDRAMKMAQITEPSVTANIKGQYDVQAQQQGYQQLQNLLQNGIQPGESITGGKTPAIRQSAVPPNAEDEKQLNALQQQMANLPKPGSPYAAVGNYITPFTGGMTVDQHRQALQNQIDSILARRGQHGVPPQGIPNGIPPGISKALAGVGPGKHTFSDGSVWIKAADGSITKGN